MVHHRISSSTRFSTAFKLDAGLCLDIYIYVCFLYNDDLTYLRFDLLGFTTLNTTFGKNRKRTSQSSSFRVALLCVQFQRDGPRIRSAFFALKKSRASLLILSFSCVSLSLSREAAALRIVRINKNDWKKRPRPKELIIKRDYYTRTTRPSSSFFL